MRAHPDINYRYLVYQDENKASGISEIEFDGEKTWILQTTGRDDAQEALNNGSGENFSAFKKWSRSDALRKEFPKFIQYLKSLKPKE